MSDEEGNITRNKILTVGSLAIILGIMYSMDVYAKHGSHSSHKSHSSHSSTSYIRNHTNHASHSNHASHNSHASHSSSTEVWNQHSNAAVNTSETVTAIVPNPAPDAQVTYSSSQLGTVTSGIIRETGNTGISIDVDVATVQALVRSTTDYSCIYNEAYYILANPDVYQAFGSDTSALFQHFLNYGMAEGRIGSPEFNVLTYKSYYSDLTAAFGDDLKSYYMHYMNTGKAEGRIGY